MADLKIKTAAEYLSGQPGKGVFLEAPALSRNESGCGFAVLPDFFLLGHQGIPVSKTGDLITERFIYPHLIKGDLEIIQSGSFTSGCCFDCIDKKGIYLPLYGDWSMGFWHWMMEKLPIVMLAEMTSYDGYYIIPHSAPFARQSMELLNIEPDRILEHDGNNWLVEILCLPQKIDLWNGEILSLLRIRLLDNCVRQEESEVTRRVYISRRRAASKKVVNESLLLDIIRLHNFELFEMEGLDLKDQIRLMSEAEALITPHGAGMVHTLFMRPRSLVLELFSPAYINPCMLPTVDLLQHRYYMIPGYLNGPSYGSGQDIEAFNRVVEITLKRELESR